MAKPKGRKPRMPARMRPVADAAIKRVRARAGVAPAVWELPKDEDAPGVVSGWFACPYAKEDEDRWYALIVDIFGTRQEAVAHVFMNQLSALCDRDWRAPSGWHTNEVQMMQLLAMIGDMKPRNAAEAASAAQLCALHLSAMKLGAAQASTWGGDPRTVAILAKTARAYSDGLMTLQRLKGRGNKSRQTIKVERHNHTHSHQHIHLEGDAENGGQPHASDIQRQYSTTAAAVPGLPALPSPCSNNGQAMPVSGSSGEVPLPDARWGARLWRSIRGA